MRTQISGMPFLYAPPIFPLLCEVARGGGRTDEVLAAVLDRTTSNCSQR